MRACRLSLSGLVALLVSALMLSCAIGAWATEVQLAGVRLGQHAFNVMQLYGQPDCVITGAEGPGPIGYIAGGGGAQVGGGPGGPGGPGGEMGGGMPGMGGGGIPGMGGGGIPGMGSAIGDLRARADAAMSALGMGGPGAGAGPGAMGPGAGPGAGAQPSGAGGGGRFASHSAEQAAAWADPVRVPMTPEEHMWCYRRDDVVLGFVLDRDGYVVKICAAGKRASWVRTAMAEPKRTVKLGDSFQTVVERYGYPEDVGPDPQTGPGTGFSRDLIVAYTYANNIAFILREMKVEAIQIWEWGLRGEPPVRLPAPGIGATPPLGAPAEFPPAPKLP